MDINVTKAEIKYVEDCKIALMNSELGRVYFTDENKALRAINEGIMKEEVYVALNNEGACLGFIWYIPNGAFHSFPYLHIIAVKEECRNLGIGSKLMKYFEEVVSKGSSRSFLVVADFNPKAKKLYENIGYKQVGMIPDLYKKGVTEYLMMKEL